MRAVGFNDMSRQGISIVKGKSRSVITLEALPKDFTKIRSLPTPLLISLKTKRSEIESELSALEGVPLISNVIRTLRVTYNLNEIIAAVETIHRILSNIISSPHEIKYYRIKTDNNDFHNVIGRLQGSELLMNSIGFRGHGSVLYI